MSNENSVTATVSINGREQPLSGQEDLRPELERLRRMEYADVILTRGSEGTFLLTNRRLDRAYLMFLTDANPEGFHCVSADRDKPGDDFAEFILSNGQEDEFPLGDTVPLSEGLHALEYFLASGGMAPFIRWHDDVLGPV